MQKLNYTSVAGQDGSMQTVAIDMAHKGRGGDDYRYVATEVGLITFRVIRKRNVIVAFEMVDGPIARRGVWEEPRIPVPGGFASLDEGSEQSEYYLSPNKRWIYKAQRIYHQLSIANLYKVGRHDLTLVHFDGLRLEDFLMREFLRSKGELRYFSQLDARTINFEHWLPHDVLRVNTAVRYYTDGLKRQKRKDGSAYVEVDLVRQKILRMVDITNQKYNYFPNG